MKIKRFFVRFYVSFSLYYRMYEFADKNDIITINYVNQVYKNLPENIYLCLFFIINLSDAITCLDRVMLF